MTLNLVKAISIGRAVMAAQAKEQAEDEKPSGSQGRGGMYLAVHYAVPVVVLGLIGVVVDMMYTRGMDKEFGFGLIMAGLIPLLQNAKESMWHTEIRTDRKAQAGKLDTIEAKQDQIPAAAGEKAAEKAVEKVAEIIPAVAAKQDAAQASLTGS